MKNSTYNHTLTTKVKMFILICLYAGLSMPGTSLAQQSKEYSIRAIVKDSISNTPLAIVTVNLRDISQRIVFSEITKDDGSFQFTKLGLESYIVTVSSVGYQSKSLLVKPPLSLIDRNLGTLFLVRTSKALDEVTVRAERALVKQEIDGLSYNVQSDADSKTLNLLDMLRKVPLVSMNGDDEIQLKGNSNFKILLNGRTSSLLSNNLSEALRSMTANNIAKIEVITTPPAKYDSEGLGGIINIVTIRKTEDGYNGSTRMAYSDLYGPSASGSVNVKNGKFGISVNGGGSIRRRLGSELEFKRQQNIPFYSDAQQSRDDFSSGDGRFVNLELSYEIDSLNLVAGTASFNSNHTKQDNYSAIIILGQSALVDQSYRLNSQLNFNTKGNDISLNYQHGFRNFKDRLLTASYKFNNSSVDRDNFVETLEQFNYDQSDFKQDNISVARETTLQLDYVHPLRSVNVEAGAKIILRGNESDFEYQQFSESEQIFKIDNSKSDNFDYNQNIFALYNSWQLTFNRFSLKAGLRLERTTIDANFISSGSSLKKNYTNLIPSIALQQKFKNNSSINLGYTQRIQRPGISLLNPFIDQSNPIFYSYGNPNLLPVLNHNFELGYSRYSKGSINLGLSYSFAKNTIQQIVTIGPDSIGRGISQNIGRNANIGANISLSYPVTQKFSVSLSGRGSYVFLKGRVDNKSYGNEGVLGYGNANLAYRFEKDWRVSVAFSSFSPSVTLQGQTNAYYYSSVGVTKELFKKKLTVSGSVSNPLEKFRSAINHLNTPTFDQTLNYQTYYRRFDVSLNYTFGKLKTAIKKNKRSIRNDDLL